MAIRIGAPEESTIPWFRNEDDNIVFENNRPGESEPVPGTAPDRDRPPSSTSLPPAPTPGSGDSQWEKDVEEFRKIWEVIIGLVKLPDFGDTFKDAFGKLPALELGSFDDAVNNILGKADYKGLETEALATIDQNLAAAQAMANARGIGQSGFMNTQGRNLTSQILGQLAKDVNQDKLQRAGLLSNLQNNMWGLQAQDLGQRRGMAADVWKALLSGALGQSGMGFDLWRTLLASKGQQASNASQQQGGMLGSFITFLGTILGPLINVLSDKQAKTNITSGDADIDKVLATLKPYSYQYKDDPNKQNRLGVMAQDLEKVRPELVIDTPAGKAIDVSQATGMALAGLARINERLNKLEGKNG